MTPSQLKEHNTMLLLLKQKEAEEQEMEENKKQEREDKISELLNKEDKTPELEHEIEEIESEVEALDSKLELINTKIPEIENNIVALKKENSILQKNNSKLDELYKYTLENKNEISRLKDNDRKPILEDINNTIDKKINNIKFPVVDISWLAKKEDIPSLENIPTKNEVYSKAETYSKEEVYNKRQIDTKLENNKSWKRYTEINDSITDTWFTRSSDKIQETINSYTPAPTYTPFILLTNTDREALTPSIWYTVYCTDEIEWLYIYTSDGRQRLQMSIVL